MLKVLIIIFCFVIKLHLGIAGRISTSVGMAMGRRQTFVMVEVLSDINETAQRGRRLWWRTYFPVLTVLGVLGILAMAPRSFARETSPKTDLSFFIWDTAYVLPFKRILEKTWGFWNLLLTSTICKFVFSWMLNFKEYKMYMINISFLKMINIQRN